MVEAARGTRDPDEGKRERIEDQAEASQLRRRALGVWGRTLLVTAVGTLLALLL